MDRKKPYNGANVTVQGHLRDCDGLTKDEYAFLFTIESRGKGGSRRSAEGNMADMRMGRNAYYKTLRSLRERNLIRVTEKVGQKNLIHVNHATVMALPIRAHLSVDVPDEAQPTLRLPEEAEGSAPAGIGRSARTGRGGVPEQAPHKENKKLNKKASKRNVKAKPLRKRPKEIEEAKQERPTFFKAPADMMNDFWKD